MIKILSILALCLLVAACGVKAKEKEVLDKEQIRKNRIGNLGGDEGISLFSTDRAKRDDGGGGIGVNGYLWQATLDTISFFPLSSADPFGGVVITEWYSPPESLGERYKLNVYILGRQLRSDGVKVKMFREIRDGSGQWIAADVAVDTQTKIEDSILESARTLRVKARNQPG